MTQRLGPKRPVLTLNVGHDSHTVYLGEICYVQNVNRVKEIYLTGGRLSRTCLSGQSVPVGVENIA